MKDSSDRSHSTSAVDQAYQHLLTAIEMYEGALWHSQHMDRARAIARMAYVKRMLSDAHGALRES